jgi:hypothetical protein
MTSQFPAGLFPTAICEAEILYGVALLPGDRRRNLLNKAADAIFGEFSGRKKRLPKLPPNEGELADRSAKATLKLPPSHLFTALL